MAWRGRDTLGVAGAETRCGAMRLELSLSFCALFPHPLAMSFVSCAVGNHSLLYIPSQSALSPTPLSLPFSFSAAFLPSCPFFCHTLKAIQFLFNFNWLERLLLLFFLMPLLLLLLSLFAMQIYSWFTFKKLLLLLIRTHTQTHTR